MQELLTWIDLLKVSICVGGIVFVVQLGKFVYIQEKNRKQKRNKLLALTHNKPLFRKTAIKQQVILRNIKRINNNIPIVHPYADKPMDLLDQEQIFTFGDYMAESDNHKIEVCMLNTNISKNCWTPRNEKTQLFPLSLMYYDYKAKQKTIYKTSYLLMDFLKLSMIGTISFENGKFIFKPQFIINSMNVQEEINRLTKIKTSSFVALACLVGWSFLLWKLFPSIISLMARTWNKFLHRHQYLPIEGVPFKRPIKAKPQHQLLCPQCKTESSTIIMSCGHLTLCFDCSNKAQDLICPICSKHSLNKTRIFI